LKGKAKSEKEKDSPSLPFVERGEIRRKNAGKKLFYQDGREGGTSPLKGDLETVNRIIN